MLLRGSRLALDAALAGNQALVDQALGDGFRWLRFPARLEHAFVEHHGEARAVKLSLAALSSFVVYGGVLCSDYLMYPPDLGFALALRIGVYVPFVLMVLAVLRRLNRAALNEWVVPLVAFLACVISGQIALTGSHPLVYTKVVELLLIVCYTTVFARFWPMVVLSLGAALVHMAVFLSTVDTLGTLRLGTSLSLLTTVSFALYACYVREHNERLAFLLDVREQGLRSALKATNERLEAAARTDALTGTANRRAFDDFLTQSWARCQAEGQTLALLMVDVDHFKAFNDRYGHQAGDRCLQAVADAIASCLRRPMDMLSRWGGEEFAVVVTGADAQAARQVAQRIRQAVEDCAMPHVASSCASVVTVSIGLASMQPCEGAQLQTLERLADQSLYQAKAKGRNCVCHGDEVVTQAVRADVAPRDVAT